VFDFLPGQIGFPETTLSTTLKYSLFRFDEVSEYFSRSTLYFKKSIITICYRESTVYHPRMLICGDKLDEIDTHLAPALLYDLEGIPVHVLDIPSLYGFSSHSPEEACSQVSK